MPYSSDPDLHAKGRSRHDAFIVAKGIHEYESKIVEDREKAILFDVPIFGRKWIPKSAVYSYKQFFCVRKYVVNSWNLSEF